MPAAVPMCLMVGRPPVLGEHAAALPPARPRAATDTPCDVIRGRVSHAACLQSQQQQASLRQACIPAHHQRAGGVSSVASRPHNAAARTRTPPLVPSCQACHAPGRFAAAHITQPSGNIQPSASSERVSHTLRWGGPVLSSQGSSRTRASMILSNHRRVSWCCCATRCRCAANECAWWVPCFQGSTQQASK